MEKKQIEVWYCEICGKDVEVWDFHKHRGHKLKRMMQNVLDKEKD